jgi:hypothetical protein
VDELAERLNFLVNDAKARESLGLFGRASANNFSSAIQYQALQRALM